MVVLAHQGPFRGEAVSDSMLLLVAWSLWQERNGGVFGRLASRVQAVVRAVLREGEEWALGGFILLVALLELWSQPSRRYVIGFVWSG